MKTNKESPLWTDTSSKKQYINSLPKGTTLEVVQNKNGFYKAKYGNGYVYIYYKNADKVTEKVLYSIETNKETPLWTDSSASKQFIKKVPKGTTLSAVQNANGFFKVKYSSGYAYAYYKNADKVTNYTNIPGAPQAVSGYELPTGSYVYPVDASKVNQVKITNTWDKKKKQIEINQLAKTVGLSSSFGTYLDFVSINKDVPDSHVDNVTLYQFFYSNSVMSIGFDNHRRIRLDQGEYILKALLKPYFPKSYSKLAEMFVRDGYMDGGMYMDDWETYDGLKVKMIGGKLRIRK
ncbi:hypothetical protein LLY41_02685 [Cytobacillus firmus]|uniref:SH3 domain-containing protein n=1 Tax=Cytobacillus firmus TaxID=1399 RepID=UPI00218BA711|nr:hypothetical protein [Cytobacillus firmus]URM33408.1 hypothetical protein LLY41_02685 [Cytobacillus firmus]